MLNPTISPLPQSRVELNFLVTPEEAKPYLDQAVIEISSARPLPGFRPGKATYEDVKRAHGEMLIWETALEKLVRALYVKAILHDNIETIGSPEIAVQKLVPGQDLEFTCAAIVMPTVTKLADYSKTLVERKNPVVSDEDVTKTIEDLRKMRRVEVAADVAATKDTMVNIDLEIKKDHVVVEGGHSSDYRVYLNETHYIPGFAEQLLGAKKGEVKTFELDFPADHYNKQLAGQKLEFTATVKDVYELQLPEANDEFAKSVGIENIAKLHEVIKENLQKEADAKADDVAEIALLDKLVDESRFSEMPELLVNEEVRRMMDELAHGIEEQGGRMPDYLASIKKTADEVKMGFIPQAIKRIQTAVLIKEIGKQEKIEIADEELDAEVDAIISTVKPEDKKTREHVSAPEYRDYVAVQMKNRKVIEILKAKGIKR